MKRIFILVFILSLLVVNMAACNSNAGEPSGGEYENLLQKLTELMSS